MRVARGEQGGEDLYSRLLRDRIVMLSGEISGGLADAIVAQILYLESEEPDSDIKLFINSPGGEVTAGMAILDAMDYVAPDVATICLGQAASMGAFLLACGTHGKRAVSPNARVMIHQPLGGMQGQATDLAIRVNEMLRLKSTIARILAARTGQPLDRIERDIERDMFLSADDAVEYGIADQVLEPRKGAT